MLLYVVCELLMQHVEEDRLRVKVVCGLLAMDKVGEVCFKNVVYANSRTKENRSSLNKDAVGIGVRCTSCVVL